MAKAKDAVAKVEDARTLPDAEPSAANPAADSAAPAGTAATTPQDGGTVAPAPVTPTPQPPAPKPAPAPSVAFRAWVQNLRISSVRPGPPARALIGATTFVTGDTVEPQMGIVFEAYNAETRVITFKDRSGATVERRI